jgi:hypothetical protein
MEPLRIGILGAARIADEGIVDPARALGHRVVAVAARERSRAEAFARASGVERALDTYVELIEDPEVDVVYNALVNSLHAPWNSSALQAGKQVLSEKRHRVPSAPLGADDGGLAAPPGPSLAPPAARPHRPLPSRTRTTGCSSAAAGRQLRRRSAMRPPTPTSWPRWPRRYGRKPSF